MSAQKPSVRLRASLSFAARLASSGTQNRRAGDSRKRDRSGPGRPGVICASGRRVRIGKFEASELQRSGSIFAARSLGRMCKVFGLDRSGEVGQWHDAQRKGEVFAHHSHHGASRYGGRGKTTLSLYPLLSAKNPTSLRFTVHLKKVDLFVKINGWRRAFPLQHGEFAYFRMQFVKSRADVMKITIM